MNRFRKIGSLAFIISLILASSGLGADRQPLFSLEAVLSAPHTSQLVASPAGEAVAWVMDFQGRKNIWVAEGPDFKAKQLTRYELDDGMRISNLQFTPDGFSLLYGYGNTFNPTSSPRRPPQVIKVLNLKTGQEIVLTEGQGPLISPDGKTVLFIRGSEPYVIPFDRSSEARRLFQARGVSRSFEWSPDSKKVLFVSFREAHSFIGIYDLEKDDLTWLIPDVYRDRYPVWSPDGKSVAFIRMPPGPTPGSTSGRGGQVPFSVWVVDLENMAGRKIWETEAGGGFAHSYPAKPLWWAADNRLVFYSEHTGWIHLYSVSTETGEMLALTSEEQVAEYEVEEMTVSPDGQMVFFNGNRDDINRRHLWKVSVKGVKPEVVTKGESVEWDPEVSADGKKLFFIQSTAKRPGLPAVMDLTNGKIRSLFELSSVKEFPEKNLVVPEEVVFKSLDGLQIHGQLFKPVNIRSGEKLPAVIFMHGGPTRQMYPAWHQSEYYHKCYAFNQYLATCGYVVLSVNFRCGLGYGASFREAPNQGPRGASEYQDILAAAEFLKSQAFVDGERIGLWGGSYGGYLTALGLARNSDIFAAGVDFHGVHDWALRAKRRSGGGWGIGEDEMEIAFKSSPVADVDKWTSPVLFIHGDDDRNVDFVQTTDLVGRLLELEKAYLETLVFPDDVHSFFLYKNWARAFSAASNFFDRFLKNR